MSHGVKTYLCDVSVKGAMLDSPPLAVAHLENIFQNFYTYHPIIKHLIINIIIYNNTMLYHKCCTLYKLDGSRTNTPGQIPPAPIPRTYTRWSITPVRNTFRTYIYTHHPKKVMEY